MRRLLNNSWMFVGIVSIFILVLSACDDDSNNVGNGPRLVDPRGIAVEFDGNLVVADRGIPAVVRIDITNGNRSILSGVCVGSGPELMDPRGIDVLEDGTIAVANAAANTTLRIDPITGDRTVLSGDGVGSGAPLMEPRDLPWKQTAISS